MVCGGTIAVHGADESQEWHFRGLVDRAQDFI